MYAAIDHLRQLNFDSLVLRILLALFIGGFVGIERQRKGRAAGFRTYMLVALGAALTVMLSEYCYAMLIGPWKDITDAVGIKTDVSRFGAQVINGVGFLGAGTVIVTGRQEVKGLTTAAGLWASACIGLAIGAGFYEGVLVGFILIVLCFRFLPVLETVILLRSRYINVYVEIENIETFSTVVGVLKQNNVTIYDCDLEKDKNEHVSRISALFNLKLADWHLHEELVALISKIDGVISVDEL